jgi:hypothetical protein
MLLPNRHSFTIVRKKTFNKKDGFTVTDSVIVEDISQENFKENVNDSDRRNFLKLLGGASVGAVVMSMIPSKAQAYIIGSSPTAGIVGVKNASNIGVNPATEDGNLATLTAKDFTTRASETTLASIKTNSDKFLFDVNGNLLTASTGGGGSGSTQIKDATSTIINPATDESVLYLRRIVKLMESQAVVDNQMRQRVTVDVMPTTTVTGTVTVGSITTLTSLNQIAGVDSRWQIIDWSRQAYNSGIRGNLINS